MYGVCGGMLGWAMCICLSTCGGQKDKLSILPLYHVSPKYYIPVVGLGGKNFYILSCLASLGPLALNLNSLTYFNNPTGQIPILILGMGMWSHTASK